MTNIIAHGSYPMESRESQWRIKESLTEEAARALLPEGTTLLNKGFWVLGWAGAAVPKGAPILALGMAEEADSDTAKGWPPGSQAVYAADFDYYLIEAVG